LPLADLDSLRARALELGADRAAAVQVRDITVSDAVAFKCRVPRCPQYASCAHCPPHAPSPEEFRRVLADFHHALAFNLHVPPEVMLGSDQREARRRAFRSVFDLAAKLESAAFYGGHYLSFGLAAGSCRNVLCHAQQACAVLEGRACPHPGLARPSLEAVGIDVFQLATLAGWEMQPLGREADATQVRDSSLTGMVVVG
jgi:predicted metal-binding protein